MSDHPVLLALPYLPLHEFSPIGDQWEVGPLSNFEGPWHSAAFEELSRTFLGSFRLTNGDPLALPSIVVRTDAGADGALPSAGERRALALAIGFATIDANPPWEPDANGWSTATTDNAELWSQPIDVESRFITVQRGSRVRTVAGGHRLDDEFTIQAPIELHLPPGVTLDTELASAVWELSTCPPRGREVEAERLLVAINWLLKAWRNSASISWEDRVVLTKTAFEALLDESDTRKAMTRLRQVFESAQQYVDDTLWKPDEGKLVRVVGDKSYDVTLLEHWYGAFADARNRIIHDGATGVGVLSYDESDSRYRGSLADVADRVLREAIKARMATLGYERSCMSPLRRAILDGLEAHGIDANETGADDE